jgi:hypothetical protein
MMKPGVLCGDLDLRPGVSSLSPLRWRKDGRPEQQQRTKKRPPTKPLFLAFKPQQLETHHPRIVCGAASAARRSLPPEPLKTRRRQHQQAGNIRHHDPA